MTDDVLLGAPSEDASKSDSSAHLIIAIVLTSISFAIVFGNTHHTDHGEYFSPLLFNHPRVFAHYLAAAFGGSILLPLLNVGIVSRFKSMRRPSMRRNIFIVWSIIIIATQLLAHANA